MPSQYSQLLTPASPGATAKIPLTLVSVLEHKHPTVSRLKFCNPLKSHQPPMFPKLASALPTAVHATKPNKKKDRMPRELDTSALQETSQSLKILHSINTEEPKRPQQEEHIKTPHASSTTKDQRNSVVFASMMSVAAPTTVYPVDSQDLPTHQDDQTHDTSYSFTTLLTNKLSQKLLSCPFLI